MLKDSKNNHTKMVTAVKGEREKLVSEAVDSAKYNSFFFFSMHPLSSTNFRAVIQRTYLRNSIHLGSVFTD
jgi:hypothetical protein